MLSCQSVSRIDSKGRISIPSEIRKTLGLNENDVLEVGFSINEKVVVLRKKKPTIVVSKGGLNE